MFHHLTEKVQFACKSRLQDVDFEFVQKDNLNNSLETV